MNILLIIACILLLGFMILSLCIWLKNAYLKKKNNSLSEDNKVLSEAAERQRVRNKELIRIQKEIIAVDSKAKRFKDEVEQIESAALSDNYLDKLHDVPKRRARG